MEKLREERTKQVLAAVGILAVVTAVVVGSLIGWRHVPGLAGEWLGTMIGIATTPFFLEATFCILGLITVVTLNGWRRHKDGDDFVYLEEVTGPEVPADLPDHAKWAVFTHVPLPAEEPTLLERAEGALAIGDHAAAAEWIGAMDREELTKPAVLRARLELAKATNRTELAHELERELSESVGSEALGL